MLLNGTQWMVLVVACTSALAIGSGCSDDGETSGSGGSAGGLNASSSTGTGPSSSSSGQGGAGAAPSCFDYSSFTPTPDVSFSDDIMPIFASSCNNQNCHGDANNPDAGLYLGEKNNNTPAIVMEVYNELVGTQAQVATNLQRVVPSDAENSWLMAKVDGDIQCPNPMCSTGCGQRMPRGANAQPLAEAELTLIRSWIQNGAPAPE